MTKIEWYIRGFVTCGVVSLALVSGASVSCAADGTGSIGSSISHKVPASRDRHQAPMGKRSIAPSTSHKVPAAKNCSADTEALESVSGFPGFAVLKMGSGIDGWFNAGEVMSFYQAPDGITVPCAKTEITVHSTRFWVQQKPEEVARQLAKARGTVELEGFVILTMGSGHPGWFNATETMAFYPAVAGISVGPVRTELLVHDYSHWVQETAPQVAQKLAEALAKSAL